MGGIRPYLRAWMLRGKVKHWRGFWRHCGLKDPPVLVFGPYAAMECIAIAELALRFFTTPYFVLLHPGARNTVTLGM